MSEVYAVSIGSYSDYSVLAIFTTREKAAAYVAELMQENRADVNEIEVYPLDTPREELPGAWVISINDAGKVNERWPGYFSSSFKPSQSPTTGTWDVGRVFTGYGLTLEHARRSAEELRRQTLALEGKVISGAPPEGAS